MQHLRCWDAPPEICCWSAEVEQICRYSQRSKAVPPDWASFQAGKLGGNMLKCSGCMVSVEIRSARSAVGSAAQQWIAFAGGANQSLEALGHLAGGFGPPLSPSTVSSKKLLIELRFRAFECRAPVSGKGCLAPKLAYNCAGSLLVRSSSAFLKAVTKS